MNEPKKLPPPPRVKQKPAQPELVRPDYEMDYPYLEYKGVGFGVWERHQDGQYFYVDVAKDSPLITDDDRQQFCARFIDNENEEMCYTAYRRGFKTFKEAFVVFCVKCGLPVVATSAAQWFLQSDFWRELQAEHPPTGTCTPLGGCQIDDGGCDWFFFEESLQYPFDE